MLRSVVYLKVIYVSEEREAWFLIDQKHVYESAAFESCEKWSALFGGNVEFFLNLEVCYIRSNHRALTG